MKSHRLKVNFHAFYGGNFVVVLMDTLIKVDKLRYSIFGFVRPGQVQRNNGRSAVGHSHGVAIWHHDR